MDVKQVATIKKELKRFDDRLDDYLNRIKDNGDYYIYSCKESGAAKRASMDLSRMLTKFRYNKL